MQTGISCSGVSSYSWDNTNWKVSYSTSNLTSKNVSCTVTFKKYTFSNYLINLSNTDASIEKVTHGSTEQTGSNATTDNRYVGSNPNNYVCLESSGSCTEDKLYRIIGVIPTQTTSSGAYENRVKLIKNTNYAGTTAKSTSSAIGGYGYYWSGSGANANWVKSTVNTEVLNTEYWNFISSYQQYIGDAKWYIAQGGTGLATTGTPEGFYTQERSTTLRTSTFSISSIAKIGLLYTSDYGYSMGSSYGNTKIDSNKELYKLNSWLYYNGLSLRANEYYEWTITATTLNTHSAFFISNNGAVNYHMTGNFIHGVRPTFYLKATINYKSGTGTISNPYRVSV